MEVQGISFTVGALHLVGASGMDDNYSRFAPLEYDSFERDDP